MIGKLEVDKKNVDIHLARKKKLTFDVSKVQDGKKRQKRRERNEKSEQISESSGKARERKRENDEIQKWARSSGGSGGFTGGSCKGGSNAVGR